MKAFCRFRGTTDLRFLLAVLVFAIALPSLHAQNTGEFDDYKVRIDGFWLYAYPSGSITDAVTGSVIDLKRDFGFGPYSSFAGKLDWKFTHKNHFYVTGAVFSHSKVATLQRTFVFQGQTFNVGVVTKADISAPLIAPGYEYDFIRRRRGSFGVAVQIDLFNTSASFFAAAQANNNNQVVSSKKSLLAPIPVAGPTYRFYLTDSPRLFVEGNVFGMYLFGYGNFVSTTDDVGVTLTKHLSLNAGYSLGSRLTVNADGKKDRLGLRLTQQGPLVGMEVWF